MKRFLAIALAAGMLFAALPAMAASRNDADLKKGGPNLLATTGNLGFESSADGTAPKGYSMADGTKFDSVVTSTEFARTGAKSGKTVLDEGKTYSPTLRVAAMPSVELDTKKTYELSAWVNTGTGRTLAGGYKLRLQYYTAEGDVKNLYSSAVTTTNGKWEKVSVTFQPQANPAIRVIYLMADPQTKGVAYWDDIALRDLSETRETAEMEAEYQKVMPAKVPQPEIKPMPEGGIDIMQNGGFEEKDATGGVVGFTPYQDTWGGIVSIAGDAAEGKNALKIATKGNESPWARFEVDVAPGAEYQIAFKYKSVGDLTDSAKFKIEFYDVNGSNFTSANSQALGWTEKSWEDRGVNFNTPNEPTLKSAKIYLRLYGQGEIYFDDLKFYMTKAPAKLRFDGDTFLYTEWEETTISVSANEVVSLAEGDTVEITLVDGENVLLASEAKPAKYEADFTFPVSLLAEKGKEYGVRAVYKNAAGEVLADETHPVYRYDRPEMVDGEGNIIVNGEIFVPVFGYHVYEAESRLAAAKAAGVNVAASGGASLENAKQYLDNCQKLGIMCVLNLYGGMKPAGSSEKIENTIKMVEAYKDHPALLGYLVMDEPYMHDSNPTDDLIASYKTIRDLDPKHLILIQDTVMSDSTKEVTSMVDAIIVHDYPVHATYVDTLGMAKVKEMLMDDVMGTFAYGKTNVQKKPIFFLGQSFGSKMTPEEGREKKVQYLFPTYEQLRNHQYIAVWMGAQSTGYYSFKETNWELVDEPLYQDMIAFAEYEMQFMLDEFIRKNHNFVNEDRTTDIWWRISEKDGKLNLIVINIGVGEHTVEIPLKSHDGRFTVQSFSGKRISGEGQPDTISGTDTVKLEVGPYDSIFYEITGSMSSADALKPVEFTDLAGYDWAKKAISLLEKNHIVNHKSDETFEPATPITRGELAMFMVRTLGLSEKAAEENFADVDPNAFYAKEVAVGKATGMLQGVGDNKYNPESPITRQDLMTIVARALEITANEPENVLTAFSDNRDVADYARETVAAMVFEEIVQGNADGTLNPLGNTTRAEAAVIMARIWEAIH